LHAQAAAAVMVIWQLHRYARAAWAHQTLAGQVRVAITYCTIGGVTAARQIKAPAGHQSWSLVEMQ